DVPVHQLRRQPDVLPAPADGQRQLVLLHQDDGPLQPVVEEDLFDGRRLQRVLNQHLDRVVPANDVDPLDPPQLLHDVLDAAAADADAGADAIDPHVDARDRDLGAVAGLAGDPLDLDGTILDLWNFFFEEALDEKRVGAGEDHLDAVAGL